VNEWLEKEDRLNTGYAIRLKRFKEIELNSPVMFALTKGPDLDMLSTWEHIAVLPTYSRITLWDEARGLELLPQDVGVGISQLLPVVVAALHHKRGIAAIEQPELHIHPALQVKLGDLFITQIRDNKSGVDQINDLVFLIETHSEHLILRLLRRIRETHENELPPGAPAVKPGEIAVYYVEPGEDGVRIKHLRVDETGEFVDRWPHGFFEERTEELF
jgi:predicted ATPase